MKRKEAEKLARKVNAARGVAVRGFLTDLSGDVTIQAQDTRTGYPFVVASAEAWEERRKVAAEGAVKA